MRKVLFLDRDGILNVDLGYVHDKKDLLWMPGIVPALKCAAVKGYEFIVVTNQSGVARGYYTEADVRGFHQYMEDCLSREGLTILAFYYCPHLPNGIVGDYAVDCNCRKPAPGMVLRACEDYDIDKASSLLIGDSSRDLEAAESAGIRGYLYEGGDLFRFIMDHL